MSLFFNIYFIIKLLALQLNRVQLKCGDFMTMNDRVFAITLKGSAGEERGLK